MAELQDSLDPMPAELVRAVISQELLMGQPLDTLFADFDDDPLGSASIAQVHKATLLDGRVVAVKVQRPAIAPKLLGDVENLKRFSKLLRGALPVDYYVVFLELGEVLKCVGALSYYRASIHSHHYYYSAPLRLTPPAPPPEASSTSSPRRRPW